MGGHHFDAVYNSCLDGALASHDDHVHLDGKNSVYKTI